MIKNIRKVSNIRYASIREMDISNGEGVGVALFVQGCPFNPHCYNCFNPDTWDFNGGKEWTPEIKDKFLELIDRPYIKRVSILGGEPLADENLDDVLDLVTTIKEKFPQKTIWIYSGYTWESIMNYTSCSTDDFDYIEESYIDEQYEKRKKIISMCDVMVDGRYIDSQRDITLKWRGSTNQRVIDIQKSLKDGEVKLWTE